MLLIFLSCRPQSDPNLPLKALIFDSWYNQYRGAITSIAVIDGKLTKGDKITAAHSNKSYDVHDLGIMHPEQVSCTQL